MRNIFYAGRFRLGQIVSIKDNFYVKEDGKLNKSEISKDTHVIIHTTNFQELLCEPVNYTINLNLDIHQKSKLVYNVPEYILEEYK